MNLTNYIQTSGSSIKPALFKHELLRPLVMTSATGIGLGALAYTVTSYLDKHQYNMRTKVAVWLTAVTIAALIGGPIAATITVAIGIFKELYKKISTLQAANRPKITRSLENLHRIPRELKEAEIYSYLTPEEKKNLLIALSPIKKNEKLEDDRIGVLLSTAMEFHYEGAVNKDEINAYFRSLRAGVDIVLRAEHWTSTHRKMDLFSILTTLRNSSNSVILLLIEFCMRPKRSHTELEQLEPLMKFLYQTTKKDETSLENERYGYKRYQVNYFNVERFIYDGEWIYCPHAALLYFKHILISLEDPFLKRSRSYEYQLQCGTILKNSMKNLSKMSALHKETIKQFLDLDKSIILLENRKGIYFDWFILLMHAHAYQNQKEIDFLLEIIPVLDSDIIRYLFFYSQKNLRIFIGIPYYLTSVDNEGKTLLHDVAAKGDDEKIRQLIEQGASPNARTTNGELALQLYLKQCRNSENFDFEIFKALLPNDQPIRSLFIEGKPLLHYLVGCLSMSKNSLEQTLNFLFENGIDGNQQDSYGRTAIEFSVSNWD